MNGSLLLYNLKLYCFIFCTSLNSSMIVFVQTYTVNCRKALDRLRVCMNIILLFLWLAMAIFNLMLQCTNYELWNAPMVLHFVISFRYDILRMWCACVCMSVSDDAGAEETVEFSTIPSEASVLASFVQKSTVD